MRKTAAGSGGPQGLAGNARLKRRRRAKSCRCRMLRIEMTPRRKAFHELVTEQNATAYVEVREIPSGGELPSVRGIERVKSGGDRAQREFDRGRRVRCV